MNEKPIDEIFVESWDSALAGYQVQILLAKQRWFIPMDNLIHQMRLRELDHKTRAGRSMERLFVSRAREYGLRDDQPFIGFCPTPDSRIEVFQHYLDDTKPFILQTPEITDDVDRLLQKLLEHPID